jgi:polyisoprenoid-binding protein YceI
MKKVIFITYCLLFITWGIAQNQAWTIISSNVTFKIKNAGFTVNGTFEGLTGNIIFDSAKTSGNKIE